jgi:hypothetical protein
VLARADGNRESAANSLDRVSGTEDWYAGSQKKTTSTPPPEPAAASASSSTTSSAGADDPGADADQPQPRPAKKQKKKKDEEIKSLDRTSGTEDWDDDKDNNKK